MLRKLQKSITIPPVWLWNASNWEAYSTHQENYQKNTCGVWEPKILSFGNIRVTCYKKKIHTLLNTYNNTTMFSGPGDMRFVSFRAFESTACEKMLMFQEMACLGNFGMACPECPTNICRCGPIAVRSTLKPTSHPYPKKDNVRALTRAAQHLIKPTAFEK
jgi:hypothetical protein